MSACRQKHHELHCKTARRELTGWCGVGVLQLAEGGGGCDVGSPTSHHQLVAAHRRRTKP